MEDRPEVAIVGGGIAGASLATALARGGTSVVVLEATERFDDRVRGESLMPWGVAEATALGVASTLRAAGAHTASAWRRLPADGGPAVEIPVGLLVDGVDGNLNLAHPAACQALLDGAIDAGAVVHRGVRVTSVRHEGGGPIVRFVARTGTGTGTGTGTDDIDGDGDGGGGVEDERTLRPSLVVGADGRGSFVRRSAGIELRSQDATSCIAGLLIEGVGGGADHDLVGDHDGGMCLLFHQGGGIARGYHVVPLELRSRYAGAAGPTRFLADLATAAPVLGALVATARAAGPCRTYPGTDTWTDRPFAEGIVLIGDAAGHNDPAIGCGLSIAMRDARMVSELVLDGARTVDAFEAYGRERAERMRRLRLVADVMVASVVEEAPNRTARRAFLGESMATFAAPIFPLVIAMFTGPETIPDELVDDSVLDLVRAA